MTTHRFLIGWLACCAGLLSVTVCEAGPRVAVVMQDDAPPLEKHAAKELAAQWKQLFDADVQIGSTPAADAVATILLGSPTTNPAVKSALGDKWPKLTDQGHVIRTVTPEQSTVVVGGGSPVATLWAVYELSHHFGVRSLLHGDYYPVETPKLSVEELDILLEPSIDSRAVTIYDEHPTGFAAWGLSDQKRLCQQLCKMKINRVVIDVSPFQTVLPVDNARVPNGFPPKWPLIGNLDFRIAGDTPGRAAFRSARIFENPDFLRKVTGPRDFASGKKYILSLIAAAKEYGLTVGLRLAPLSVPVIVSDAENAFHSPLVQKQAEAYLKAALEAFRNIDAVYLLVPAVPPTAPFITHALPQLMNQYQKIAWHVDCEEITATAIHPSASLLYREKSPPQNRKRIQWIACGSRRGSVLPELDVANLEKSIQILRTAKPNGYLLTGFTPADLDPGFYFLARSGFKADGAFAESLEELIAPVCGADVVNRVAQSLQMIDEAGELLRAEGPQLGIVDEETMLGQDIAANAEWPGKVRTLYTNAMNEMYRANSRSRGGARAITLYYAKRCEFGLHFMTCVEALQKSRKPGLSEDEITAQLEAAHEALYSAQNALAEVARDQSDRGIIAVVNEFGYRPLKKALEER